MQPWRVKLVQTAFRLSKQSLERLDEIVASRKSESWFRGDVNRTEIIRRLIDAEFERIMEAKNPVPPPTSPAPKAGKKKPAKKAGKK